MMRRVLRCALLAIVVLAGDEGNAATPVDLQLVLAIDTSGSVDAHEFALQLSGIAAAFRDDEVVAAIGSGPEARIVVSAVFWAESGWPKDATPWYVLDGRQSAERFARLIEDHPRRIEGGTGIGSAVMYAMKRIRDSSFASTRKVIDVSGDGRETTFREWRVTPGLARSAATAQGITVNGLAILTDEPDLVDYYEAEVIGGFGAFVVPALTIDDFARAMRLKLLREIEYRPVVGSIAHDDR